MKLTATHYPALRIIIGCFFLFLASVTAHAQTRGTVEVIKDPRIDTLAARRLEAARMVSRSVPKSSNTPVVTNNNTTINNNTPITIDGYRVQFFSGPARDDAYNAQARLNEKYPNLRTYIIYREPDFKVHAGDCRTRLEATKLVQQLRPLFPTLFIISEKINPTVQ
jgi:hypothetical protein